MNRHFKATPVVTRECPPEPAFGTRALQLMLLSVALGLLIASTYFPGARSTETFILVAMVLVLLVWLAMLSEVRL